MYARPTGSLFTGGNMDGGGSERWSQQLMEGSQDWSTWLGGSQDSQRSSSLTVRPTVVSWSHGAGGRGGGVRVPPSQPSLQQSAMLPDPRDVTLARDIRVGLHTILSVMSSVPEQLKEVVAEVGRVTHHHQQEQQQEPHHHEETRRMIKDIGDTLHTLLTGLQEAVTHIRQEQEQAVSLQKETLKKHDEQMNELIQKMEKLGGQGQAQLDEDEEERRAQRERARMDEALAETKKELRRQVQRLKVVATGTTASVEKTVGGLQESVASMFEAVEVVRGLVTPYQDNNKSNGNTPPAACLRQVNASYRNGFDEVLSSVRGLEQVLSDLSSHLSGEICQAVQEALQQHPIILITSPNASTASTSHLNTSISVSPIHRTFSAHPPVLPLNESFSLCQTSPIAHVTPITQVSSRDTLTTTTITTTTTTIATTTTNTSFASTFHHHHHRQMSSSSSVPRLPHSRYPQSTPQPTPHLAPQRAPQRAPPRLLPSSPPRSTPTPSHPQPVNTRAGCPQRVNSNKATLPQQLSLRPPHHPQHILPRLLQPQQMNPKPSRPQQPLARASNPQHLNPRSSHSQHSSSRPSYPQHIKPRMPQPQQTHVRLPRSQQSQARAPHSQHMNSRPHHPQQLNPRPHRPHQIIIPRVPYPQQGNSTDTSTSQRMNIRIATTQQAFAPKPKPPQQAKSISIGVNTTKQPSQQEIQPQQQPPPPPQHTASTQHPHSQQNTKTASTQHPILRPKPLHHTALKDQSQQQQIRIERPPSPPPQHTNPRKAPQQQHDHLPPSHTSQHQHNPTPINPQHSKVRVTTVRLSLPKIAPSPQPQPSQQATTSQQSRPAPPQPPQPKPQHFKPIPLPQQQCSPASLTQQDFHMPHHSSTTEKNALFTSTPKLTAQTQPQPTTTAWEDHNTSLWQHNISGLEWPQQGGSYDPFCDDFSADGMRVDHEEVVMTSFDEGRSEKEEEEEEQKEPGGGDSGGGDGAHCNRALECCGSGDGNGDNERENVECHDGGEGKEAAGSRGHEDCFSSSASSELEWIGTQHFTPQQTYSLVQVVSNAAGQGTLVLGYDTSSSEESPVITTRNTLASMGVSPPPPATHPSGSTEDGQTEDVPGNKDNTFLNPSSDVESTQQQQPQHTQQANTGPTRRQETAPLVSRTVTVAAVAPSTLRPTSRPEATPNVRRTPWRTVMPPGRRRVSERLRCRGTSRTVINARNPLVTPQEPVVPQGGSSFATPMTGVKRRHVEEEMEKKKEEEHGEASCVRAKRFLVTFPTPAPRLVLVSSGKGRLRASLADTV